MQLEQIPIDQLRPAPYNPRVPLRPGDPGWEKLRCSLQEFDLVQPIVWNRRTGHVVGGHQRLEILRAEGRREIDCVVVDLPLDREQALNVTLNNRGVGSDWDPDRLVALLAELCDLPEFDATLTGFSDQELRDLLFRPEPLVASSEPTAEGAAWSYINVVLDVPAADWEEVRCGLDELLAKFPRLRVHVGTSRTGSG